MYDINKAYHHYIFRTTAVLTILRHLEESDWTWISSSVVLYEVNQIPNTDRKQRILRLCDKSSEVVRLNEHIYEFSETLKKIGFKSYDALHLSCANTANADVFLSTDDRLVKKAQKNTEILNMSIDNPLNWLQKIW